MDRTCYLLCSMFLGNFLATSKLWVVMDNFVSFVLWLATIKLTTDTHIVHSLHYVLTETRDHVFDDKLNYNCSPQNHAHLPNTYTWDFPHVIKFRVAVHTISQKAIRFRHPDYDPDRAKSWSVRPCPDTCRHATFHTNSCTRFWVILVTDRQTDKHRGQTYLHRPLSGVIK